MDANAVAKQVEKAQEMWESGDKERAFALLFNAMTVNETLCVDGDDIEPERALALRERVRNYRRELNEKYGNMIFSHENVAQADKVKLLEPAYHDSPSGPEISFSWTPMENVETYYFEMHVISQEKRLLSSLFVALSI